MGKLDDLCWLEGHWVRDFGLLNGVCLNDAVAAQDAAIDVRAVDILLDLVGDTWVGLVS